MTTHITTKKLFTGKDWINNCTLVIEDGIIRSIDPCEEEPAHELLVPAFIDLQVYGAGGKLFSAYPEPESLKILYDACVAQGTHFFLPTVATNSPEIISRCIHAVRLYWESGGQGCLGLHLEGPWLNPKRKGAHLEQYMYAPSTQDVQSLLDEGKDVVKMITLAPERCSEEVIKMLLANDILLSAGHSDATYDQAINGFNQGISLATHLYNTMSPFQHRAPGLAGAILHHPTIMSSIIPDGFHVNWVAVQLALQLLGDRLFVITDAVTETNEGPYQHHLATDYYESNGVLSGSALSMLKACNNLMRFAKLDITEALKLCSLNPARAFKMDHSLGKLLPGYKANFISLVETRDGLLPLNSSFA
jgi:N-acetylglucosamine-6-phosphate deacetylase